jgi:hypothetical protein
MNMTHASSLTDSRLATEVVRLSRAERKASVALIIHLAEFDSRRLYEGMGFDSLFAYCMKVLRLSEDEAGNRIGAARLARAYPEVIEMLGDGRLTLTTARMLKRYVTAENHGEVFAAAARKSKREVEKLIVRLSPQPDVKPLIRALPTPPSAVPPATTAASIPTPTPTPPPSPSCEPAEPIPSEPVMPPSGPRPLVRPTAPERYEIRFAASADMVERVRLAQDMLSHSIPDGDLARVFDRALTLLVEDLARQRFAATDRPGPSRTTADDADQLPAALKRAVWVRDRGRCKYVSPDGRRCESRRFIQFHHLNARGRGGKNTLDNVELRCGTHNRYEGDLVYGPGTCRGPHDRTVGGAGITRPGTGVRPGRLLEIPTT